MQAIDIVAEINVEQTVRVQQIGAMFDVPAHEKSRVEWHGEIPIDRPDWSVGLIVGPSGSGKSTIARQLFGSHYEPKLRWTPRAVIDDCAPRLSVEEVSQAFSSVGFNSIPSWVRPYAVLSNGERFRVELARRLLELPDPIVVDEFTSVIDRQVAQIGAFAVQKYVRKNKRRFVGISCHYDVIDWLQPDWIFEPATMAFTPRGSLQQRPSLDISICRVPYSAWHMFSPFHYMSASLNRAAKCFGLFVGKRIAAFAGILGKPISGGPLAGTWIAGVSRVVTLPDWQGLGLAFVLLEKLAAAYAASGHRFRNYPAHPAFIRAHRKTTWRLMKAAGNFSTVSEMRKSDGRPKWGGRPCAVYEYIGPVMDKREAQLVLGVDI